MLILIFMKFSTSILTSFTIKEEIQFDTISSSEIQVWGWMFTSTMVMGMRFHVFCSSWITTDTPITTSSTDTLFLFIRWPSAFLIIRITDTF